MLTYHIALILKNNFKRFPDLPFHLEKSKPLCTYFHKIVNARSFYNITGQTRDKTPQSGREERFRTLALRPGGAGKNHSPNAVARTNEGRGPNRTREIGKNKKWPTWREDQRPADERFL